MDWESRTDSAVAQLQRNGQPPGDGTGSSAQPQGTHARDRNLPPEGVCQVHMFQAKANHIELEAIVLGEQRTRQAQ